MLLKDVEALKTRFRLDVKGKSEGRLVLKSVCLPNNCASILDADDLGRFPFQK